MKTIFETLKQFYGYDTFRPGQQELIEAILEGKDVLGVMPTGGGKSLCYQIPAIFLEGTTLVISPLISLMKDQVDTLQSMGVKAAYINSQLSFFEQQMILDEAAMGELDLLYVSPERLDNEFFFNVVRQMKVNLVAVDEAHCVSQWGHDFRPSYQMIPQIMEAFENRPPFAAFTATATDIVQADMINQLHLENPYQYVASFDRPNLYFSVVKPTKKRDKLISVLDKNESSIIYCNTRKNVESVYTFLNKKGFPVTLYHAGISSEERMQNQEQFLYDRKPIIVATNAFGMGIDKSNVRKVIHYNMPLDMESYYQEAGRAGRDGAPAEAVLFYSAQDIITNTLLIERGNSPHAKKNLNTMITYCKTGNCLRKTILNYFNQSVEWNECENCSNCTGESITKDITVDCQKILSNIHRMRQAYGTGLVTDVLRGKKNQRIEQFGFDQLSTYGIMKEYKDTEIKDMISIMVSEGYLKLGGDQYPILQFTGKTPELLKGQVTLAMRQQLTQETEHKTKTVENIENYDEHLFEELRALRTEIAQNIGKPPFVVFTDRSLIDMAAKFPQTEEEFLAINGVGEAKLTTYGEQFIPLIQDYVAEQSIEVENKRKENVSSKAVTKPALQSKNGSQDSAEETLQLFQDGQSVEEIAELRGLSSNTIVNHLSKAIEEEKAIDYTRLVSPEREAEIRSAITEVGKEFLKPIKEAVTETITYNEIKFVLAKLKLEEKKLIK